MRALLALSLALAALALSSCGNTLQDQPIARRALEPLLLNTRNPIYWLGGNFQKLQVTTVSQDPGGAITVAYGDCVTGGQSTCVPPLQIVTSPDNSFLPGASAPRQPILMRGVRGVAAQRGETIELATGAVVVDIYADSSALALAAAQGLAPINEVGLPGERLPPAKPDTGFAREPIPAQKPPATSVPR